MRSTIRSLDSSTIFGYFYWEYKCRECTVVQTLRLCTGRTAHRGSRGIALLFHDNGIRRGWGVSVTPRPLFTPGKEPVPIVQEAGWAPGPVCTSAENLAPTGIWSPDRPARSQSLYRLCYKCREPLWLKVSSPFSPCFMPLRLTFGSTDTCGEQHKPQTHQLLRNKLFSVKTRK
jgi:hypothetical protein